MKVVKKSSKLKTNDSMTIERIYNFLKSKTHWKLIEFCDVGDSCVDFDNTQTFDNLNIETLRSNQGLSTKNAKMTHHRHIVNVILLCIILTHKMSHLLYNETWYN